MNRAETYKSTRALATLINSQRLLGSRDAGSFRGDYFIRSAQVYVSDQATRFSCDR